MLVGNLVAILASGLVCIVVSLIKPDNYDWKSTREITMVDDAETGRIGFGFMSRLGPALPCVATTGNPRARSPWSTTPRLVWLHSLALPWHTLQPQPQL